MNGGKRWELVGGKKKEKNECLGGVETLERAFTVLESCSLF
jgi:hypothetical protein